MERPSSAIVALIIAVTALVGCSDDGGDPGTDGGPGSGDAASDEQFVVLTGDVRDNVFVPERVLVSAGTEVRWENRGRTPHNVVAADEGAFEDVPVDELQPGDEAARTFEDAGDFPYFCSLHGTATRGQVGELRVVDP